MSEAAPGEQQINNDTYHQMDGELVALFYILDILWRFEFTTRQRMLLWLTQRITDDEDIRRKVELVAQTGDDG